MDPGDLLLLDAIITEGGITAAAASLGQPKTTISRRLRRLEAAVGSPLFERAGRRLRLTAAGEALAAPAHAVRAAMSSATTLASAQRAADFGTLTVASPYLFTRLVLSAYSGAFLASRPLVTLSLRLSNLPVDPLRENIDIAISIPPPTAPYLIVQKLAEAQLRLYGAPEMAARVTSPDDLRGMPFIATANVEASTQSLHLTAGRAGFHVDLQVRGTVNDPEAAAELIAQGAGIGVLPGFLAQEAVATGRLIPILPDWQAGSVAIHAALPPQRLTLPIVRAYLDGLKQELARKRFAKAG